MPIPTSPDAQRVCNRGGVLHKLLEDKLVTLRDLEKTLDVAIADAKQAIDDEYFWRAMEVSTKLVLVTCDLTIAGLEDAAGPVGKGVSAVYDVAKLIVDGFNNDMNVKKAGIYSANVKIDAVVYQLDTVGAKKYGKALSHMKTLANLGNDLYDYWNTGGGKQAFGGPSGTIGARNAAFRQLQRIQLQIKAVEEELARCTDPARLL
jgi:hypothetical protein